MLPIIETPTFEIELPSSGEIKRFRPFLVKEEKILMLASEGGEFVDMISACEQVVSNCSLEDINAGKLSIFDLQHIFMRLKEKSIGSTQEFTLICGGCEDKIKYTLELKDVKVQGLEDQADSIIKVNDDVAIELEYPSAKTMLGMGIKDEPTLLTHCISKVHNGEEVITIKDEKFEDVEEFIDNLPLNVFEKIQEFFNKMPRVEHIVEYKCHKEDCGHENRISINGYEHFFG